MQPFHYIGAAVIVAICLVSFAWLGRRWPCNPEQRAVSGSMAVDLAYCAIGFAYAGLAPAGAAILARLIAPDGGWPPHWLAAQPLAVQVVLLILAIDFIQYWLHRAFHSRWLWPIHAIHHSATEVNWSTTFRIHPINYLIYNTMLAILGRCAGFSNLAFALAAPLWFVFGVLAHANLNWTWGPLRYCVVSPRFHRWHHTQAEQTRDRNFAPLLPIWDLMFGTFLMPVNVKPANYGAPHTPQGLFGQLIHPFRGLSFKGEYRRGAAG